MPMPRAPLRRGQPHERFQQIGRRQIQLALIHPGPGPPELILADRAGTDGVPPFGWQFGGHLIELHRSEAEGYFLNTTSPDPKVFVMWRTIDDAPNPPLRPEVVTVSYNEAARLLDGGESVDAVPMPPEIMTWLAPFVAEHYKPEPKRKVKRNDPFAQRDGERPRRR